MLALLGVATGSQTGTCGYEVYWVPGDMGYGSK